MTKFFQKRTQQQTPDDDEAPTSTSTPPVVGLPVVVAVVVPATPLFQTTLRQKITPYLPPPVVVAMKKLDPELEPYIGPEPSITLMGTFCLALLLWQMIKVLSKSSGGSGKAIQDDPQEKSDAALLQPTKYYDETILLCGPSLAGKTSLFYELLDNYNHTTTTTTTTTDPTNGDDATKKKKRTVKSLQPNSGYYNNDNNDKTMMLLDLPGYWDTQKVVSTIQETTSSNSSHKPTWIVVVLDSTQSATKVVDYLYDILSLLTQKNKTSSKQTTTTVVIACHKSKAPKAKNVRRIKLQLRTELERLSKLKEDTTTDWEAILNDNIKLCATSCDPPLLDDLLKELQG
jgi:signal recognition particle receptor subunit beta